MAEDGDLSGIQAEATVGAGHHGSLTAPAWGPARRLPWEYCEFSGRQPELLAASGWKRQAASPLGC